MENKKNLIKIGSRLETHRKEAGLSRQELAEKCNVNRTTIHRIEKGELNFTIDLLLNILKVLNKDLSIFSS